MSKNVVVEDFDSFEEIEKYADGLGWSKSAKWHFSRLQLGRTEADKQIEAEKRLLISALPLEDQAVLENPDANKIEVAAIMKPIIIESVDTIFQRAKVTDLRELQYIINTNKNQIVTVCTRKHNLIKPKIVQDVVTNVLQEKGFTIQDHWGDYLGVLATSKTLQTPLGTLQVGLSIGLGRWDTTRAIMAGIYFEIPICTNPLSFLELSNTMGTRLALYNAKVLRLGDEEDILNRTRKVIATAVDEFSIDAMPPIMIKNGNTELQQKDAIAVIKAMTTAYTIGKKVQTEIIDSYQTCEPTIWSLAMIISKISTDSDNFRKDAIRTPAKLAAIGLVLLTTKEVPKMIQNSYTYCQEHGIEIPA